MQPCWQQHTKPFFPCVLAIPGALSAVRQRARAQRCRPALQARRGASAWPNGALKATSMASRMPRMAWLLTLLPAMLPVAAQQRVSERFEKYSTFFELLDQSGALLEEFTAANGDICQMQGILCENGVAVELCAPASVPRLAAATRRAAPRTGAHCFLKSLTGGARRGGAAGRTRRCLRGALSLDESFALPRWSCRGVAASPGDPSCPHFPCFMTLFAALTLPRAPEGCCATVRWPKQLAKGAVLAQLCPAAKHGRRSRARV